MTGLTRSLVPADTSRPVLDLTAGELLRRAAEDGPDRVALVSVAPGREARTWTYAELLDDAERAATWLLDRFSPGDALAVWAPNVPEWVVLQHGAALAGLVLVTANPALRGAELAYVLTRSRAAGIAHADASRGTDMAAVVQQVLAELPAAPVAVPLAGWLDEVRRTPADRGRLPQVDPASPAQVQFTSGTTGAPKAAVLRHAAMVTNAEHVHERAGSPPHAVWVSALPLFHTAGCGLALLGTIARRGTLVLAELFDPALVLAAVQEHRAQVLAGVPAMLQALLAQQAAAPVDVSSVQVVMSGGDAVPPALVDACRSTFGAGFSTVYGQTELSPILTQTTPYGDDDRGTAGRPLWGLELAVLDPAGGVVPVGAEGEVCARGYSQMVGYLDMPEETAATVDADGWLHTGDLGRVDGTGCLTITGRLKDMVIRGGENIYPREVEDVLRRHPAVADAVVLGLPDERWGETVAAVVWPTEGGPAPGAGQLRSHVREHLAPHKTPSSWWVGEDLPVNAMGKLQKFRLRDQVVAGRLAALEG